MRIFVKVNGYNLSEKVYVRRNMRAKEDSC